MEKISIVSHSIPLTMQAHTFRPNNGSERAPSGLNLGDETCIHARNPKRGVDARRADLQVSSLGAAGRRVRRAVGAAGKRLCKSCCRSSRRRDEAADDDEQIIRQAAAGEAPYCERKPQRKSDEEQVHA